MHIHMCIFFIYIHTYVHLTLQRAKLTLQRAFFSKWCIEGSNRRGQGSGQAALCSQSSHADWSRVLMKFHIWNLIPLVLVIAWIGFAVRTWQAYDAPVQVAGDCLISTVRKDWAAGCVVGGGVSSQSAVSWKKLACFYSHFCQVVNVKVVDAIPAKWIQVRKVPARLRPVQEDSFAVFFAGWDSCFLASHERSWQPESLFTTSESEAKEQKNAKAVLVENSFPQIVCRVSGVAGSELVRFFSSIAWLLRTLGAVTRAYSIFHVFIAPLYYILLLCQIARLQLILRQQWQLHWL